MRSAIGNSLLLNLVIIFVSLIILFFVGILSYSKAYRVKNRIVELIEEYETYDSGSPVVTEIENNLDLLGYSLSRDDYCLKKSVQQHISNLGIESENIVNLASTNGYNYCVFEIDKVSKGKYYVVVTFVKFEFPVIGNLINIPVYGETKILGIDYNY